METLQRAIADACLAEHGADEFARDPRGFFETRGVSRDDVDTIVEGPGNLLVYRSLVRNGLSSVVLRILAGTRARLNAARTARFDADLSSFLDRAGPRTHYLRDVPGEFFRWAEPRWRSDPELPSYLSDFASFELAHFGVATSESAHAAGAVEDVALDRPIAFVQSARLARYEWAVHELSPETPSDAPDRRSVHLLGYRDAAHTVHWVELMPLASAVVELLISGETLGEAVRKACASQGAALDGELEDIARLLSDLGSRGVFFGAKGKGLLPDTADAR